MQVTNEGYILTRNVIKVDIKKNKIIRFFKTHKISIIVSVFFTSLVITEIILLNNFVKLLSAL